MGFNPGITKEWAGQRLGLIGSPGIDTSQVDCIKIVTSPSRREVKTTTSMKANTTCSHKIFDSSRRRKYETLHSIVYNYRFQITLPPQRTRETQDRHSYLSCFQWNLNSSLPDCFVFPITICRFPFSLPALPFACHHGCTGSVHISIFGPASYQPNVSWALGLLR